MSGPREPSDPPPAARAELDGWLAELEALDLAGVEPFRAGATEEGGDGEGEVAP